jgi:hypothetical protein
MEKPKHLLRYNEAYKLMNARTADDGTPLPFSLRFVTRKGEVVECENVVKTVSYNRRTGMRRIILDNGEIRNIYDVLLLQVSDTKILVK